MSLARLDHWILQPKKSPSTLPSFIETTVNKRKIVFEPHSKTFLDTSANRRYRGSLKLLKAAFYPSYTAPKVRRNEDSSKAKGTLIHRHIAHRVNCVRDKVCSCIGKKTNTKRINKVALAIIEELEKNQGITLERAELPVLHNRLNFGTQIDLVGIRHKGTTYENSVLISVKTGYKKHFKRKPANGRKLKEPFDFLYDTPLSHHQVQVLVEYLLSYHEYNYKFDECLIIYGSSSSSEKKTPRCVDIAELQQYISKYDKIIKCIISAASTQ